MRVNLDDSVLREEGDSWQRLIITATGIAYKVEEATPEGPISLYQLPMGERVPYDVAARLRSSYAHEIAERWRIEVAFKELCEERGVPYTER